MGESCKVRRANPEEAPPLDDGRPKFPGKETMKKKVLGRFIRNRTQRAKILAEGNDVAFSQK